MVTLPPAPFISKSRWRRDQVLPKAIEALREVHITLISGGWRHTMAADDTGQLHGWGWNRVRCTCGGRAGGGPLEEARFAAAFRGGVEERSARLQAVLALLALWRRLSLHASTYLWVVEP